MRVEFPSLINPERYIFVYDSSIYESGPVCSCFRFYYTRDSNVDSGRDFALLFDLVGEYLISLAKTMIDNTELVESLHYRLPSEPSDEMLSFATKLVYKEGKKIRYYSTELKRISSVKSKKYDRRWEEIRSNMNGTPESIFGFLNKEYSNGLEKYVNARKIRKYLASHKNIKNVYMDLPAEFVGWTTDTYKSYAIDQAWSAIQNAIELYKKRKEFENNLAGYKQHMMLSTLEN